MARKDTKIKLSPDAFEKIEEFANQADTAGGRSTAKKRKVEELPWQADSVRDDVTKTFLVRMPEAVSIKVTWLSEKLKRSKHSIYLELFTERLDEEIDQVLKQDSSR